MTTLNYNIRSFLVGIMLLASTVLFAQHEISFRRITINDGLSLSSVYYIFQDSKGFMWFATEDGLNKYDGTGFTVYNHTPGNPNSLSYKWIEKIVEDRQGNLWLSTRQGLSYLNPSNDKVLRFFNSGPGEHHVSNDTILNLHREGDFIWVGTMNGLDRFHTGNLNRTTIDLDCDPRHQQVLSINTDHSGRTWVGTNGGLHVVEKGSDQAQCITSGESEVDPLEVRALFLENDTVWVGSKQSLMKFTLEGTGQVKIKYPVIRVESDSPVENIYRDSDQHLWVTTSNGLYSYGARILKKMIPTTGNAPSLAMLPKKPLLEDSKGAIWMGTFSQGVYRITPGSDVYHYAFDPTNPTSLSDNTVNCIYEDRAGGIWIGTFGSGISVYDPHSNIIKTLKNDPFDPNSLTSSFIWSILESNDQKVWIGTNNAGINIYDPATKNVEVLKHDPDDPSSLPEGSVREIFQDRGGTIWVGTDGGGLSKYNRKTGSFSHFRNDPGRLTSISSNSVRTIYQDSTGILWIGTRNGLNSFDPRSEKFRQYLHNSDVEGSLSNNFVYSAIYMDKRGYLWVGTYGGGLNRLNTKTGQFTSYQFELGNPSSISDDIVFAIYEDEKGYFWIGTNSGLNLFNPSTGKFKRYGTEAGLPNDVIYGIMPDHENRLWITTNKGISRLDLTEFRFKNFDVNDGLQSNEFNGGASHRGKSGRLYAGGVYGLNIIEPEKIKPVDNHAELTINRLEILGKEVQVLREGMIADSSDHKSGLIESVENYYLPRHVAYLDEIRLNYRQRFFSIEFAALNHHLPEKLNYRYRMRELEDHWNLAGNRNYVTYANMKPGTYIFEADASNSDGFLASKPAQLKIIITPPFWRSYWFMLMMAMIVLAFIVFIYRFLLNQRMNNLLKSQYEQIKVANEKLQQSENDLKDLNATKDKFFSIISHDLKNPFSSVLSISELMSKEFESTETSELKYGISKIHDTNRHIYELLENLLTWSKTQRDNLTMEKVNFNLSRIIETNLNVLRLSAEKKEIKIETNVPDEICAYADREMISTVFRNLANNSIKFTPVGKSIRISAEARDKQIIVKVEDQGVGIPPDDLRRLFRIEEKFKREGTAGEKGTGLGLIICHEFIGRNGGEISVESTLGQGSIFTFTVPEGN